MIVRILPFLLLVIAGAVGNFFGGRAVGFIAGVFAFAVFYAIRNARNEPKYTGPRRSVWQVLKAQFD